MTAHLCVELELVKHLAAAVDSFWEPVSESLIRESFGSSIAHRHNAISMSLGDGPVLTEPTRLSNNNKTCQVNFICIVYQLYRKP